MTVQNKIYEGMAMAKPVITGDSPAIRQAVEHLSTIYLCERQSPRALADAIRVLKNDPGLCKRLGENSFRVFHEKFDILHIGQTFYSHLVDMVGRRI